MPFIDIELSLSLFQDFVKYFLSFGPKVPFHSIPSLFGDRWISNLIWGEVRTVENAYMPGRLLFQADATISHINPVDFAQSNLSKDDAVTIYGTAWLAPAMGPPVLHIDMTGIADKSLGGGGVAFSKSLAAEPIDVGSIGSFGQVTATAMFVSDDIVTMRLAFSIPSPFVEVTYTPPANRLKTISHGLVPNWLIHVPGDFFVEATLDALRIKVRPDGTSNFPGTTLTKQPSGEWMNGVIIASAEYKAKDACGLVDLSIGIDVEVRLIPDASLATLTQEIRLSTDISDWDLFRCYAFPWGAAGTVALSELLAKAIYGGITGIILGIAGGFVFMYEANDRAKKTVESHMAEGDAALEFVGREDDTVIYRKELPLPKLPYAFNIDTKLDSGGLWIFGTEIVLPPSHEIVPDTSMLHLQTFWGGSIDCSLRTMDVQNRIGSVALPYDKISRSPGAGLLRVVWSKFLALSTVPVDAWRVDKVTSLTIKLSAGTNSENDAVAIIQTTCGILRLNINFDSDKSAILALFDLGFQSLVNKFCDTFLIPAVPTLEEIRQSLLVEWVQPPPPDWLGRSRLQQWLISIEEVPPGTVISIDGMTDRDVVLRTEEYHYNEATPAALELVSEGLMALRIGHTQVAAMLSARISQRWLLPLRTIRLHAPIRAIAGTGGFVGVLVLDHLVVLSSLGPARLEISVGCGDSLTAGPGHFLVLDEDGQRTAYYFDDELTTYTSSPHPAEPRICGHARAHPLLSITLPDGSIAACHGHDIIFATPFAVISRGRQGSINCGGRCK